MAMKTLMMFGDGQFSALDENGNKIELQDLPEPQRSNVMARVAEFDAMQRWCVMEIDASEPHPNTNTTEENISLF